MDSAAVQAVTTIGDSRLNELRLQFARRHQFRTLATSAVAGPAITVSGIAQFGGPRIGDGNSVGFDFTQKIWQVDRQLHLGRRARMRSRAASTRSASATSASRGRTFQYTFPTIDAYLAAEERHQSVRLHRPAADLRRSATELQLALLRLLRAGRLADHAAHQAAVRPALRPVRRAGGEAVRRRIRTRTISPSTRTTSVRAPACPGRSTTRPDGGARVDRQDVRAAAARFLRQRDPEQRRSAALQRQVGPGIARSARRPFPTSLASARAGFVLPRQSITAVDHRVRDPVGLAQQRAGRARAGQRLSVAVGYVNAIGRNLPVLIDSTSSRPARRWRDGRPIYSTAVSAATRVDPTFDHINVFQSIGESHYNAFTADDGAAGCARLAGAGHLHAGARHRQRAAHRHLRRRQRRRSRLRSVQSRSGQAASRRSTRPTRSSSPAVIAPQVARRRPRRDADQQQPGRRHLPGQQRAAVQHPLEPGSERRRRRTTIGRSASSATAGRLGSVFNLDLRYSRFVPIAPSRGPNCSSKRRTCSTARTSPA